jgi:hypothetical protein
MPSSENIRYGKDMNKVINFWCAVRGNAGAEFALLLPLLVVLLFGGLEIGRLLHDYHAVRESVRGASRYLSRVVVDCAGFVDGPIHTASDHVDNAKNLALRGKLDPSAPYLLGYWTDPNSVDIDIDCSIDNTTNRYQGLYDNVDSVPHIVVSATVPFTFLFGQMFSSSGTIDLELSHKVVGIHEDNTFANLEF